MNRFEDSLRAVATLADDLRRRMYLFIRAQRRPVGRDEAAEEVGISRKLAAFHLDKLVDNGLLKAHYSRLSDRVGPGAGRPSKVYEPTEIELDLSIPSRSYDLAGQILVKAVADSSAPTQQSVCASAREQGREVGRHERKERRLRKPTRTKALAVACDVLYEKGYEPYLTDDGSVRLNNCPFHALAQQSTEVVCGLNHAFIEGVVAGLGADELRAVLDPRPGECCVRLARRENA